MTFSDDQLMELWDVAMFRATTRGTDPVLEYAYLILEQCHPNAKPTSPSCSAGLKLSKQSWETASADPSPDNAPGLTG